MKPSFGEHSLELRATLHPDLIAVLDAVMDKSTEEQDFAIIDGLRNEEAQALAFNSGTSNAMFPTSYHNGSVEPDGKWNPHISDAVDVAPYPIEWPDVNESLHDYVRKMRRFYDLAERILKKAYELEIELEWGGMFKKFFDGPHFQRRRK